MYKLYRGVKGFEDCHPRIGNRMDIGVNWLIYGRAMLRSRDMSNAFAFIWISYN